MNAKNKFSYRLEGTNGQGVMLLHGLTGIPGEMRFIANCLHKMGYTVYVPLLAGHGQGTEVLIQTRWQDWLGGVVQEAKMFAAEVEHLFVAGICVGGKLGMLAAHQLPGTIKAAAIYSPCFRYNGWNVPWYYKLAPIGLPVMMRVPRWRKRAYAETETLGIKDERLRRFMAGAEAEGVIDQFPAISLWEMYKLGIALKKKLPKLATPSLILHSKEDDLSHPRNAKVINKRMRAPHRLEWIEDSYHMLHVDRQNRHVAQRTAAFFQEAVQ